MLSAIIFFSVMEVRSPSYFAILLQTLYFYHSKVWYFSWVFSYILRKLNHWVSRWRVFVRRCSLPLSKKNPMELFVCLSHTGGLNFSNVICVHDAIGQFFDTMTVALSDSGYNEPSKSECWKLFWASTPNPKIFFSLKYIFARVRNALRLFKLNLDFF